MGTQSTHSHCLTMTYTLSSSFYSSSLLLLSLTLSSCLLQEPHSSSSSMTPSTTNPSLPPTNTTQLPFLPPRTLTPSQDRSLCRGMKESVSYLTSVSSLSYSVSTTVSCEYTVELLRRPYYIL